MCCDVCKIILDIIVSLISGVSLSSVFQFLLFSLYYYIFVSSFIVCLSLAFCGILHRKLLVNLALQKTMFHMSCLVVLHMCRMQWRSACRAGSISTSLNQCVRLYCSEETPPRSLWGPEAPRGSKAKFSWSRCPYACHRSVWTPEQTSLSIMFGVLTGEQMDFKLVRFCIISIWICEAQRPTNPSNHNLSLVSIFSFCLMLQVSGGEKVWCHIWMHANC